MKIKGARMAGPAPARLCEFLLRAGLSARLTLSICREWPHLNVKAAISVCTYRYVWEKQSDTLMALVPHTVLVPVHTW